MFCNFSKSPFASSLSVIGVFSAIIADNFYGEANGFTDEEIRRDVEEFKKDHGEYIENVMQTKCKLDYTKLGIKVSV